MRSESFGSVRIFSPRLSRDEVIEHLRARIPHLRARLPLTRLVLFGSYATGRHTVASDIDVLVVYAGDPLPQAYAIVRNALALPGVEPHVYAEREAERMADTIERMIRDGIPVFGGQNDPGSHSE
jgi:predicted nucleotidyltransferase